MSEIKNIKLNGTNISLEENEIKKIRYNGDEYTIGGSGSSTPVDNGPIYEGKYRVRYFDTDGTILKIEYVESGGKTTPPDAPSYDPDYLIFAEWNYDTANYIVEQPTDIGAIYDTVDDATYMFCRFTTNTGLNPTLAIGAFSSIDWGDGTVDTNKSHSYANEGEYIIKIYGSTQFTTNSSNGLFGNILNSPLQKIYIKNGTISLGTYTFDHCYSLKSITIPKSITKIGNSAFDHCYSLKSITIPRSVTSIGPSSFNYCKSLTSVTIPNSVTSIGNNTFYECNGLVSVTIPRSVTSIGSQAFFNCFSLTNCFIECDTVPTLSNTNAFNNINLSAIMWVNNSIVDLLNVATNWSTYASYMKPRSWYPSVTGSNS